MPVAAPALPRVHSGGSRQLTVGILSSFPPTPCGIATFTAALGGGLRSQGADLRVVRISDGSPSSAGAVVGDLVNGRPSSVAGVPDLLNACDVAIIQHEYGLYGGADGDEVVSILASLRVPSMLIAHTVLCEPTPHQRAVMVAVSALTDRVVVMTDAARARICKGFGIDPGKVVTIPHGAAIPDAQEIEHPTRRPTMLTWGLVGPGKGIERVIDAMPHLHDLPERPQYLVAGRTHPKVVATSGEAYREARIEQAHRIGVGESVTFDGTYRDVPQLTAMIQRAAVVVLPYDSREQATSGVLVDAVAAGRPVVATAFPHAVELLAGGAGIVVDHDDQEGLVGALRDVLTDVALADRLTAEARRIAPTLGWPVVAAAYLRVARDLMSERAALA